MKKKAGENKTSLWNKLSIKQKAVVIIFFLIVIVPYFLINGYLWFSNWLFQVTSWNINAFGLGNTEWFAFWGTYFGGIATVVAVWWTVKQTERHYEQTSKEQKRQNESIRTEQEKQRKLDVLPLILLQPRVMVQSSDLAVLLGETEEKPEEKRIYVDQLKPFYEEFDISEITVLFGLQHELRSGGLSDDEIRMVKNKGHENVTSGSVKYLTKPNTTFLRPFWLINTGKETAINLVISLVSSDDQEYSHLSTIFSLMPKAHIKLNFLVNVKVEDEKKITGDYKLLIKYSDIYANHYKQEFPIYISNINHGIEWSIGLNIEQLLEE